MENLICTQCKRLFFYVVGDMGVPGGKERENIYCPYCNKENGSVMTSGFIYTYKEKDKQ